MELGNFQKSVDSDEIKTMAFEIIGESVKAVSRICEQWGEAEDEVREPPQTPLEVYSVLLLHIH